MRKTGPEIFQVPPSIERDLEIFNASPYMRDPKGAASTLDFQPFEITCLLSGLYK
jgi:hypothetical protein